MGPGAVDECGGEEVRVMQVRLERWGSTLVGVDRAALGYLVQRFESVFEDLEDDLGREVGRGGAARRRDGGGGDGDRPVEEFISTGI